MQWRVVVELSGAAGAVQVHEVHSGGSTRVLGGDAWVDARRG
jgi:hypothetical protein